MPLTASFSVMNRLMKAGSVLVTALDLSHCTSASACSTDQRAVCPAQTPRAPRQQGPQQEVAHAQVHVLLSCLISVCKLWRTANRFKLKIEKKKNQD